MVRQNGRAAELLFLVFDLVIDFTGGDSELPTGDLQGLVVVAPGSAQ